jgi:hypothetical protein
MFFTRSRDGRTVSVLVLAVAAIVSAGGGLGAQSTSPAKPPAPKAAPPRAEAPKPDAEKPDAALPSARSIIDRHIKAIGGREAVLSHTSTHATGTFSVPAQGLTGTVEIFGAANPNRSALKVTVPGLGEIASGFDGSHGWSMSPLLGPMLQVGKELEQAKFDADFYGDLRDAKRYRSMQTLEKTTFDNRPCYKVSLVRLDGLEDLDFYDAATGLRAGSMNTRETPMGSVKTTSIEGDYKKFANLLMPTTVVQQVMGVEQKITLASVEFDNVSPSAFELPAPIKALIK